MKQMKKRNTRWYKRKHILLLYVPEIKYAYGPNECQTSAWQLTRVSVCLSCLSHVKTPLETILYFMKNWTKAHDKQYFIYWRTGQRPMINNTLYTEKLDKGT